MRYQYLAAGIIMTSSLSADLNFKHEPGTFFSSYDIEKIQQSSGTEDDLIVLSDGTKLAGKIVKLPQVQFFFGKYPFQMNEIAAISFSQKNDRQKMEIVTRDGYHFICDTPHEKFAIVQQQLHNMQQEVDPTKISHILFKKRGRVGGINNRELFALEMKNGDRVPVILTDSKIRLSNGWKDFNLGIDEIVSLTYDDGLYGDLKDHNGRKKELDFSFVKDKMLRVQVVKSSHSYTVPWDQIATVSRTKAIVSSVVGSDDIVGDESGADTRADIRAERTNVAEIGAERANVVGGKNVNNEPAENYQSENNQSENYRSEVIKAQKDENSPKSSKRDPSSIKSQPTVSQSTQPNLIAAVERPIIKKGNAKQVLFPTQASSASRAISPIEAVSAAQPNSVTQSKDEFSKEFHQIYTINQQLEQNNLDLKRKLLEAANANEDLQEKQQLLVSDLEAEMHRSNFLNETLRNVYQDLENAKEQTKALAAKLNEANSNAEKNKANNNTIQLQNELQETLKKQQVFVKDLEEKRAAIAAELKREQILRQQIETAYEDLENKVDICGQEISRLNKALSEKKDEYASKVGETEVSYKQRISELIQSLTEERRKVEELNSQINKIGTDVMGLNQEKGAIDSLLAEKDDEIKLLKASQADFYDQMSAKINELIAERDTEKNARQEWERKFSEVDQTLAYERSRVRLLQNDLEEWAAQANEYNQSYQSVQEEKQNELARLTEAQTALCSQLASKIDGLIRERDFAEKNREEQAQRFVELDQSLAYEKARVIALENELEIIKSQSSEYTENYANNYQELTREKEIALNDLSHELEGIRGEKERTEQALEKQQALYQEKLEALENEKLSAEQALEKQQVLERQQALYQEKLEALKNEKLSAEQVLERQQALYQEKFEALENEKVSAEQALERQQVRYQERFEALENEKLSAEHALQILEANQSYYQQKDVALDELNQQIEALRKEKDMALTALNELNQQIDTLKKEKDQTIESHQFYVMALQYEMNGLTSLLNNEKDLRAQVVLAYDDLKKKTEAYEDEIAKLNDQFARYDNDYAIKTEQERVNYDKIVNQLKQALKNERDVNEGLQDKLYEYGTRESSLELAIEKNQRILAKKDEEIKQLKEFYAKFEELEKERDLARYKYEGLQNQIDELTALLSAEKNKTKGLEWDLEELTAKSLSNEEKLYYVSQEKNNQVQKLLEDLANVTREKEQSLKVQEILQDRLYQITNNIQEHQKKTQDMETQIAMADLTVQKYQEKLKAMEETTQSLAEKTECSGKRECELEEKVANLDFLLKEELKRTNSLEIALAGYKEQQALALGSADLTIENLEDQLYEVTAKLYGEEERAEQLKKQLAEVTRKLNHQEIHSKQLAELLTSKSENGQTLDNRQWNEEKQRLNEEKERLIAEYNEKIFALENHYNVLRQTLASKEAELRRVKKDSGEL